MILYSMYWVYRFKYITRHCIGIHCLWDNGNVRFIVLDTITLLRSLLLDQWNCVKKDSLIGLSRDSPRGTLLRPLLKGLSYWVYKARPWIWMRIPRQWIYNNRQHC